MSVAADEVYPPKLTLLAGSQLKTRGVTHPAWPLLRAITRAGRSREKLASCDLGLSVG